MTLVFFHLGEQTREINLFWVYAFEAIFTIIMLVYWSYDGSLIHPFALKWRYSDSGATVDQQWKQIFIFVVVFAAYRKGKMKKFW